MKAFIFYYKNNSDISNAIIYAENKERAIKLAEESQYISDICRIIEINLKETQEKILIVDSLEESKNKNNMEIPAIKQEIPKEKSQFIFNLNLKEENNPVLKSINLKATDMLSALKLYESDYKVDRFDLITITQLNVDAESSISHINK